MGLNDLRKQAVENASNTERAFECPAREDFGSAGLRGSSVFHYVKSPNADAAVGVGIPEMRPIAPKGLYSSYLKRFLDFILILATAPIVVPVVIFFAILIKLDGGPIFYGQPRIGRDGRRFTCWKLRSMVVDADAKLTAYLEENPAAKAEWLVSQKLKDDPRITNIGHFIRKASIDELPQLWCILKGEMSLVGPRPFLPEQKELYKGNAYYMVRPGLTGFWQVLGRNESSFAARTVFDNRYLEEISLKTDLVLILRTVGVVLRATGV